MPFFPPQQTLIVRSGGGFFATALAVVIGLVLAISLVCNFFWLASSADPERTPLIARETRVAGDANQQIAVVPIYGFIDRALAENVDRVLSKVEKDSSIRAVVLELDTPGGEVTASDEIYQRVLAFKKTRSAPVVATMGALGTSGGYYIACAADHIFAEHTTMTGNIGVIWQRFNFADLMEKWGIKDTTLAATGSTYKTAGSMSRPEAPEATRYLQEQIDLSYERFKSIVSTGRKGKLKATMDVIANGKAYLGPQAKEMGLVDDIGYASDAYAKAEALAGLKNAQVVRYQLAPTLLDALGRGASSTNVPFGSVSSGGVTVNGINVQIDRKLLNELSTPQMLYWYHGN